MKQVTMETRKFLGMVFFDVAGACNLACPFCVFDWRTLKKATLASPEVLAKVISLAPHMHDGSLALSCAHEPTMHPRLDAILNELPDDQDPVLHDDEHDQPDVGRLDREDRNLRHPSHQHFR